MRRFPVIFCLFLSPVPAFAHLGHVGEVAGHGHLIAIGAAIAAATVAALVAKAARKTNPDESEDKKPENAEPEGEPEAA